MTEQGQFYKCLVCGIVVEILDGGAGEPVCCGQPMRLLTPRTDEPAGQHAVELRHAGGRSLVRVGGRQGHPDTAGHFIQWIAVQTGRQTLRRQIRPDEAPQAEFALSDPAERALAMCSRHGLWSSG